MTQSLRLLRTIEISLKKRRSNMLEIMLIIWAVVTLALQFGISVNMYAKLTEAIIVIALVIPAIVIVIRCKMKHETIRSYLKADFDRIGEFFGIQVIKLVMAGIILTQFVRVDVATVTDEYVNTVKAVAQVSGIDESDDTVEYMLSLAPVIPICVKQYIVANMNMSMFNMKYELIVTSLGEDINDDQYAILMQGLVDEEAAIKEARANARKGMSGQLSYALIYIFANVARSILIKRRDKYRSTDEYKKRDIFEGVNLRGD